MMPKTTYALRVVLILLSLSLLAGAVTGNRLYFRLSYVWGVLLVLSWLMSIFSLRGVTLTRNARVLRSSAGQIFEERYEVINSARLPRLWIEVRDESPLPGSQGSHVLTLIGGRESRTYLARARLVERGVFTLGPTVLASGDIFGLFPTSRKIESQHSVLVYPMMVHVRSFPSPPGLLPGGEALRRRTPQITSNAAGVREYEPGDPLNRIHWVSTARRNRLMVKEFELDPLAEVWIFVDAERAAQAIRPVPPPVFDPREVWRKRFEYKLSPSTLEYSVTAAASLARYYLRRRRAVGLAYSGPTMRVLPPDRGGRQLGKILESLALLRGDGFTPLHSLVETQARHLPRGSTVVMITPSSSELVYRAADMITRRGLRPVVVLVDAATFGGFHNPDAIVEPLQALGVPYCRISEDDDLSEVLSTAVSSSLWS
jgi:uncharacterized protein (DUF58 family)